MPAAFWLFTNSATLTGKVHQSSVSSNYLHCPTVWPPKYKQFLCSLTHLFLMSDSGTAKEERVLVSKRSTPLSTSLFCLEQKLHWSNEERKQVIHCNLSSMNKQHWWASFSSPPTSHKTSSAKYSLPSSSPPAAASPRGPSSHPLSH